MPQNKRPRTTHKDPFVEPPIKDLSYVLESDVPFPSTRRQSHWRMFGGLLVVALALIAGVAFSAHHAHSAPQVAAKHLAPKTIATNSLNSSLSATVHTTTFGLQLGYPAGWSVTANNSHQLLITSPITKLLTPIGKTVPGTVVLSIGPGGQLPAAYGSGQAVAVLPSQIVSYTNPSAGQPGQTYVSFLQYSAATIKGTLNGIYVTENNGYQFGQLINTSDMTSLNPLIQFQFYYCTSTNCQQKASTAISSTQWSNTAFAGALIAIIQSIISG